MNIYRRIIVEVIHLYVHAAHKSCWIEAATNGPEYYEELEADPVVWVMHRLLFLPKEGE